MDSLDTLRSQHIGLLRQFANLSRYLDEQTLADRTDEVVDLLERIDRALREHLHLEDDYLYPALEKRTQSPIRDTASRFATEMGGLQTDFSRFSDEWASPQTIRDRPLDFIRDTREIADALCRRITREDNELFPLLEDHRYSRGDVKCWIEDWQRIRLSAVDSRGGAAALTAGQAHDLARQLLRFVDLLDKTSN